MSDNILKFPKRHPVLRPCIECRWFIKPSEMLFNLPMTRAVEVFDISTSSETQGLGSPHTRLPPA